MSLVKEIVLIFIIEQVLILMRERRYIDCGVYKCEWEGVYVNTPGVRARVEYPRLDVRNDVVVPHFFHLRTCD